MIAWAAKLFQVTEHNGADQLALWTDSKVRNSLAAELPLCRRENDPHNIWLNSHHLHQAPALHLSCLFSPFSQLWVDIKFTSHCHLMVSWPGFKALFLVCIFWGWRPCLNLGNPWRTYCRTKQTMSLQKIPTVDPLSRENHEHRKPMPIEIKKWKLSTNLKVMLQNLHRAVNYHPLPVQATHISNFLYSTNKHLRSFYLCTRHTTGAEV